jgi:hypothetical protein
MTRALSASHNRVALAAMALNVGWTSVGAREMTRRISLVAACPRLSEFMGLAVELLLQIGG